MATVWMIPLHLAVIRMLIHHGSIISLAHMEHCQNYWMLQDGHLVNGSIQPGMKDALVFLNKMYTDGLIDPEFVTDDPKRWQQKVKAVYLAQV